MRRSIWDAVALFEKRIRMIRKPAYGNIFCRKTAFLILPRYLIAVPPVSVPPYAASCVWSSCWKYVEPLRVPPV